MANRNTTPCPHSGNAVPRDPSTPDRALWADTDRIISRMGTREIDSTPGKERPLVRRGCAVAAKELRSHLSEADVESTQALVAAVEAKDPLTRSHSLAVATYASTIGRWLGLSDRAVSSLWSAGLLHDVGKIGVPDAILTKPGPLTQEEFAVVQRHPRTATQILEPISTLHRERALILHHHERYDGTGYPSGLARERIPMGARVLAVADSLDTMLSPRAYKPRYSMERARCELTTGAGRQFDARVVDVTLSWLDEAATELTAHADS